MYSRISIRLFKMVGVCSGFNKQTSMALESPASPPTDCAVQACMGTMPCIIDGSTF